jgi:hypothetical protein
MIADARVSFRKATMSAGRSDRQILLAAGLILTDLAVQGWQLRTRRGVVEVRPPIQMNGDRTAEKARVRRQELVKRDAQLEHPAVQDFLQRMERPRMFGAACVSIFSLMREGRDLAESLRQARQHTSNAGPAALAGVIDPYLQFVASDTANCSLTGLRLMDIWRYFRHTWTNQYLSVPGRSMMFLVRDQAAAFHPIVGIGALSSPVVQIRERDAWIGWHPDAFLASIKSRPTAATARWLVGVVEDALSETYVDDLIEDGLVGARDLARPSDAAIEALLKEGAKQRRLHHRHVRSRDQKGRRHDSSDVEYWVTRARTHLFRSKRALALAWLLRARVVLTQCFGGRPSAAKLAALASTGQGSDTIRKILKKAKANRIGIAVADITVCGAVQPYNAILGGKLVAMLAASPEVVLAYRHRYSDAESEIASAVAGRPLVREPNLVLLGTTSLYGIGSSQYNRIKIPCDRLGGAQGEAIRYVELGRSEAFGTSQYSEETLTALTSAVQQSTNGQRVNSIFGEGVSPKFRKVRQGLEVLDFPADLLLRHHRRRVVYGISLVSNLRDYLLGFRRTPNYLVPLRDGRASTARIAAWWKERWLCPRIASDEVLDEVARHTLVRPVRHGARVRLPASVDGCSVPLDPY